MAKQTQAPTDNNQADNTDTPPSIDQSLESPQKQYDLGLFGDVYDLVADNFDDDTIKKEVTKWTRTIQEKHGLEKYNILFLVSDNSIARFVSNRIYQALNASDGRGKKDILLVLDSPGGKIEPAYLISKTCKKWCKNKFSVAVPRMAKSAATLLSLGSDQIHMGQMSELGPIDLQIGDLPALGLNNALNVISQLTTQYPQSGDMWASYLTKNLNLMHLGYFDRINSSASQYGERLLAGKKLADGQTPESITRHLVHHYKDHSFVIDYDECLTLFGPEMVKFETPEYKFSNEIVEMIENLRFMLEFLKRNKTVSWIGGDLTGLILTTTKTE